MSKNKLRILSIAATWVLYVMIFWAINPMVMFAVDLILSHPEIGFPSILFALAGTLFVIYFTNRLYRFLKFIEFGDH